MKRLIIYNVPIGNIGPYTNEEDILVNACDIHRCCIGCFGCWLKPPASASSRTDSRTWANVCSRSVSSS